jgi:hypothetical protein
MLSDWIDSIEADGFALVPGAFAPAEVAEMSVGLAAALESAVDGPMSGGRSSGVVAARNVLTIYPAVATLWRRPPLAEVLTTVLGERLGLVRVLFFDKPPNRSWSLAWHKDLTIAVRDHALLSSAFSKPTIKAGVPHVEAPLELLEHMLTLRVHLDEVTDENGPLKVIPGSHHSGKTPAALEAAPVTILARAGDVLAMRPLVAHASAASQPGTWRHRRILHLEFAAQPTLADGYEWHDFVR